MIGAITPETNITNTTLINCGINSNINAIHADKHDAQVNGLKFNFNFSPNLCISTKKTPNATDAIRISPNLISPLNTSDNVPTIIKI